jgi:hypothetical protein
MAIKVREKATSKNPVILVSRYALRFLAWVSRGRLNLNYDARTTTVGSVIYVGTAWQNKTLAQKESELAHEGEHVRQWRTWWVWYPVSYMLTPWAVLLALLTVIMSMPWYMGVIGAVIGCLLPAGLSMRAYWEYRAFKVTLSTLYAHGDYTAIRYTIAARYTELLTGKAYYYAASLIPGTIRRAWLAWLDKTGIGRI